MTVLGFSAPPRVEGECGGPFLPVLGDAINVSSKAAKTK
jgi:hypothetical protein